MYSFRVEFNNGQLLTIKDIVELDDEQQDQVKAIASEYTQYQLKNAVKYGNDLFYLTSEQKLSNIKTKDSILQPYTPKYIFKNEIIYFLPHSLVRCCKG